MLESIHIIGSRRMGGAERFYARFVRGLHDKGHGVMAVTRPFNLLDESIMGRLPHAHVPMINGWDAYSLLAIRNLVRKMDAPIVQTYQKRASRLTRISKIAIHIARIGGYQKVEGYYAHADACVGISKAQCDYLIKKGLPADRVYYIGNCVEIPEPPDRNKLSKIKKNLGIPGDAIIVFSLGRFVERKGFEDLVSAISKLPKTINDRPVMLLLAGDGPERQKILEKVRDLGLTSRFRWVGWQKDTKDYFHLSDIFAFPSRVEILGNVFLEAWAHGLPVVSTCTPGVGELMEDGVDGLLVPPSNPKKLAETLHELINMGSSVWRRFSDNALKKMREQHSVEKIINEYNDLYSSLRKRYGY